MTNEAYQLFGVALYAENTASKDYFIGIHFAIARDEDEARAAVIATARAARATFDYFIAEVLAAPVDAAMLPRIQEIMKWKNFVEAT